MRNQSCSKRSHCKNCLFFVIFLGVQQRSGVPATIRNARNVSTTAFFTIQPETQTMMFLSPPLRNVDCLTDK